MAGAGARSLPARRLMFIPALAGGQRGKGTSPQAGWLLGGAGLTAVAWHPGWRRGEVIADGVPGRGAAPTRAGRIPRRVGYGTARNRLMSD
jgi:hypothetical protein